MTRRAFLAAAAAALPFRTAVAAQPGRSRLILLGTAGGPTPKTRAAAPAQIIVVGDRGYLIDCGNGVGRQMALAGVFRTLRHVFITHHHSDHNADYGTLLLLEWGDQLKTPIDTWGPPPLAKMTRLFLEMSAPDIAVRMRDEGRPPLAPLIRPHEVRHGGAGDEGRSRHGDERGRPAPARAAGVRLPLRLSGSLDRDLRRHGAERCAGRAGKGADVLVHEALYVPAAPGEPGSLLRHHIMQSHTSVEDAGRIAARAGVGTLVLSHFVPTETPRVDRRAWLAAARTTFSGRIVVGKDLLEL